MIEYIYLITNLESGKVYVGRTNNPANRKRMHFSELKRGVHGNPHLQASFNKHGMKAFEFKVVDSAETDLIQYKEAKWFQAFETDILYNCHFKTNGGPVLYRPHTPESIAKIAQAIRNQTRQYIFDILDKRYEGVSIRKLASTYKVSSNTLIAYTPEWEVLRKKQMPLHPQRKAAKDRVALFVKVYQVEGNEALRKLKGFKLSRKTLQKYLKDFNIHYEALRLDEWKSAAKQRAFQAIEMVKKTGCSVQEAIRKCNTSTTTYYKYA